MLKKKKKALEKTISLSLSILVLIILLISVNTYQKTVRFSDSGLEEAVRDKINKPHLPLLRTELLQITHLDASGRGIKNLEGIENLRRLSVLNLRDNMIDDLSPIKALDKLKELDLRNNSVENLESISGLESLVKLNLRQNKISHIEALLNLKNIKELNLNRNNINTIEELQDLSSLEKLNLGYNDIFCLNPLKKLTALKELNIDSNYRINNFSPIERLKNLRVLILNNIPLEQHTKHLKPLTKLEKLSLRNCHIKNWEFLEELFSQGILQNDVSNNIFVGLDIRDNPFSNISINNDNYAGLRPYWDNTALRKPLNLPNHFFDLNFSHQRGLYRKPFYLEISSPIKGVNIYYTLNGSEPDPVNNAEKTFLYENPIKIFNRTNEKNTISLIEPGYGNFKNSEKWQGPKGKVFKGQVIRVKGILNNTYYSKAETHTYFIDENIFERYGIPIISLTTSPDNLFDYEKGIYVKGKIFDDYYPEWRKKNTFLSKRYNPANFHQRGKHLINAEGLKIRKYSNNKVYLIKKNHGFPADINNNNLSVSQIVISGTRFYDGRYILDGTSCKNKIVFNAYFIPEVFPIGAKISMNWERPIHFEYFNEKGGFSFAKNLGLRIHGNSSRVANQKNLRLYARKIYQKDGIIKHRMFDDDTIAGYKRLLLRRPQYEGINDVFGQTLMAKLDSNMDIQRWKPCVVFINGEFWGYYFLRDRYDKWYFSLKYNLQPQKVAIVRSDKLINGNSKDLLHYNKLQNIIKNEDITASANFDKIKRMIDLDNLTSYFITSIFINYYDWEKKHQILWRYKDSNRFPAMDKLDGRWRFLPVDLDIAFDWKYKEDYNYLKVIIENKSEYFLGHLLKNHDFMNYFINRFADALNTVFKTENSLGLLKEVVNKIPPSVVEENIFRWNDICSLREYLYRIEKLEEFLIKRPAHQWDHLTQYFNIEDTVTITIRSDFKKGAVRLNSIKIDNSKDVVLQQSKWQGKYFKNIPITLTAIPYKGYKFLKWKETGITDSSIVLTPEVDVKLTAIFVKE